MHYQAPSLRPGLFAVIVSAAVSVSDEADRDQPHLAGFRGQAPSDRGVQALAQSPVHRQGPRHRGLYSPDAAVVLCFDEKSQIQALDRSAPMPPLMPGVPEWHTLSERSHRSLACAVPLGRRVTSVDATGRTQAESARRRPQSRLRLGRI
jgi:hypothetical protein